MADTGRQRDKISEAISRRHINPWRLLLLFPGVIAVLLVWLARSDSTACEGIFSRAVYPALSSVVGYLPSLVSFSIAQVFVIIAVLIIAWVLIYYVMRLIKRRGERLHTLYNLVTCMLGIASIALFCFTMLCGLNYYRHTFAQNEGYALAESSSTELANLCNELVDGMNDSRSLIDGDMSAYIEKHGGFEGYATRSVNDLKSLATTYETLSRPLYSRPKPVTLLGELMSDADITGMFFAFTVESNVNTQPPFFTLPATMAHELAHQCGYMREDEANFIAYLTCVQSSDPLVRYSGYSLAYSYAISALLQVDEQSARNIAARTSSAVHADRVANAEFWAQHEGAFHTFAQGANDAYLKANDQSDGTRSYSRMVDLLLAKRIQEAAE